MHIGTGIYEGKEIKDPIGVGPLSARNLTIKEEVFAILGVRVAEATVLDINDPNGLYGIEALSRGAAVCLFVNPEKSEAKLVSENLKIIGIDPAGLVINDKAESLFMNPTTGQFVKEKYDVIFFEIKAKEEISLVKTILEKQKPSGVTAIIYPNNKDFELTIDNFEGCRVVETREFDDKRVAIVLKINL
jgi:16S rRNA G966 N2-methylase RsmD